MSSINLLERTSLFSKISQDEPLSIRNDTFMKVVVAFYYDDAPFLQLS